MLIRVVDFETTGTPEDQIKGICEVGFTDLLVLPNGGYVLGDTQSTLINPGHAIPPVTQAVHHISDEDVADAPSPDHAAQLLMEGLEEGDIFAAHNAQFEQGFFSGGNFPWICTYKCAQHLFIDAPKHSNQVLRYWLGLDGQDSFKPERAMPPHRAGPDTYITALILGTMLTQESPQRLIELTTTPVLLQNVTFGKHKGSKWSDLPWDYLDWIVYKSDLDADTKHTARHYLEAMR